MRKPPTQQQVTSHVISWSSGELPKNLDVDLIQTEGGRGGGGGLSYPLAKKSNHCKTVQAKANKLSYLSLNLTGNILKSSWRVRQYWFYHGNRVCILSKKLVLFLFLLIEFLYYP